MIDKPVHAATAKDGKEMLIEANPIAVIRYIVRCIKSQPVSDYIITKLASGAGCACSVTPDMNTLPPEEKSALIEFIVDGRKRGRYADRSQHGAGRRRMSTFQIYCGDALAVLKKLDRESVDTCITSPPYWGLRDYGVTGQIGLERTPEDYVARLVEVFREVRRVLKDNRTLWLNLGDSYFGGAKGSSGAIRPGDKQATNIGSWGTRRRDTGTLSPTRNGGYKGLKGKDLCGIPWRVAFALQADGWYLRAEIIWAKKNCMPESVGDRVTRAHEQIFHLAKSERYYYDADAIREPFTTDPADNYPARAYITGRGDQDAAAVRGNDRGKGGGFPPKILENRKELAGPTHSRHRLSISGGQALGMPEGGRNKRSVWTVPTQPFPDAHFAVMPEKLVEPCILAACPENGTVLDPVAGSGTVGAVALLLKRNFIGIDLNQNYVEMARRRLHGASSPLLGDMEVVA